MLVFENVSSKCVKDKLDHMPKRGEWKQPQFVTCLNYEGLCWWQTAGMCIYINIASQWVSTRVVAHVAGPFQKNQSNTSRVKTPLTSLDQRVTWDCYYWTHSHTAQWKFEMWRLKTRLVVSLDKVLPPRLKQQLKPPAASEHIFKSVAK